MSHLCPQLNKSNRPPGWNGVPDGLTEALDPHKPLPGFWPSGPGTRDPQGTDFSFGVFATSVGACAVPTLCWEEVIIDTPIFWNYFTKHFYFERITEAQGSCKNSSEFGVSFTKLPQQ